MTRPTCQQFLEDFTKDLIKTKDFESRHILIEGYAAHMEAREEAIKKERANDL